MKEFNIFLSGAITCFGKTSFNYGNEWREELKDRLEKMDSKYKVSVTNPNDYYNFLSVEYDSELEVQKFDLDKVKNSDLVIVNFNVRTSIGTSKEIAIANEYNIPVIGLNENDLELHPWDINDCRRIFTDKEKLIDYVHKFYLN